MNGKMAIRSVSPTELHSWYQCTAGKKFQFEIASMARNFLTKKTSKYRNTRDFQTSDIYLQSQVTNMAQGQVQVYFTTTSPDIELPEGKQQLLVPTSKF